MRQAGNRTPQVCVGGRGGVGPPWGGVCAWSHWLKGWCAVVVGWLVAMGWLGFCGWCWGGGGLRAAGFKAGLAVSAVTAGAAIDAWPAHHRSHRRATFSLDPRGSAPRPHTSSLIMTTPAISYIPDILECLGTLAGQAGSHREAARLFGAVEAIRLRIGAVRFKVYDAGHEASVAALRDALGENDFESAWDEGAALSTDEAIAYAQRGRGQRKRPSSGWASLTPTEHDVVRLVSEGLTNNDVAARLFISPRTVQTHLTHVYTKLGLSSRVQLVQEAARHV
jgi:DNA-binding CsgD family transcriptional regulator